MIRARASDLFPPPLRLYSVMAALLELDRLIPQFTTNLRRTPASTATNPTSSSFDLSDETSNTFSSLAASLYSQTPSSRVLELAVPFFFNFLFHFFFLPFNFSSLTSDLISLQVVRARSESRGHYHLGRLFYGFVQCLSLE